MSRPLWKRYGKRAVKIGLAMVVLVALGRHVDKTWRDLETRRESLHVDPAWIAVGGALYLAGLTAFGIYFGQVMKASPSPIGMFPSIRAYLISHLGQYVPGKAMVVVTRVGLSTPFGARPATAALATFYETLVMMAGGSAIAVAGFAVVPHSVGLVPLILGFLLAGAFLATVEPRVFPRITRLVTSPFPSVGTSALPYLSHRLLAVGLLWSILGWTLLGLSQVAVVRAVAPEGLEARFWPLVVGSVALATVAGFVVAVMPGGLGVREGVLMATLAPALGVDTSVVAALALRLTWVVAEALAAAVFTVVRPTRIPVGPELAGPGRAMISVVVPLYNEAESLPILHAELDRVFAEPGAGPAEFIFVDDGSRDSSWSVVRDLAGQDPRVRAVRFRGNFGKAAALSAGFRIARGELVFTLDGDLQDDPAEIPRFLEAPQGGLDVVSGWKRTRHDPWHKVYPSRVFNWLVSRLTGCWLHDHNCGFKVYRREVVCEVGIYGELHRFIPVLAQARGFRVGEIEVHHRRRVYGSSKYGVSRFVKGFLDLLTVRFLTRFGQRPLHILGAAGLALFVLGGMGLFYLAALWVLNQGPIGTRPLLVYSTALLVVGTQLLSLGILAELVTFYNVRAEDTFSVAETVNGEPLARRDEDPR